MSVATDKILQLNWSDSDGQVVITPEDEDRFSLRIGRVIKACHAAVEEDEFKGQFNLLLKTLVEWLRERRDVRAAYVTLRDGEFLFLVVRNEAEYSAEFADNLSELDLKIASDHDLKLVKLDTLALPSVSSDGLASFMHPEFNLILRETAG